jgi:hypothetical protein
MLFDVTMIYFMLECNNGSMNSCVCVCALFNVAGGGESGRPAVSQRGAGRGAAHHAAGLLRGGGGEQAHPCGGGAAAGLSGRERETAL